ncbi:ABC transporter substrate-binding protein, partial [Halorubrum sp. SS5]
MAIDREELVSTAYFGFAEPAHSLINPAIAWAYQEQPENAQMYNPERARELLDEAGYTGEPRFSGSILGTPTDERVMTVLQQQLSNVGIDATLDV